MYVQDCLDTAPNGHLTIGGADTVELANTYGTPLYVMDEATIRENCRQYKRSMEQHYGDRGLVCYASKAFSCKEIYRIMASEGMGIDVVSHGELYTAMSVGFPADRIVYHGNNKTQTEIEAALDYGVRFLVVDNPTELALLNRIAGEKGMQPNILFRIKPGIDAHTHSFVQTGQIDSKFGFALENGEAMEAVKQAVSMQHVKLVGLHCHIGSQIFDISPFELAAKVMIEFMARVREETDCELSYLNLGGGFGIQYTEDDDPVPYEGYLGPVSKQVEASCKAHAFPVPFIMIEPGRSIVGSAGITLYTVGGVKTIAGVRTYLSIDGGMTDNPRYALYQSEYEAVVADRAAAPRDFEVTIAGRCCESGDLIGEHMHIQQAQPGDRIAVLATGAYNYSMASHYNRVPNPPVVMVKDGKARLIVRGETVEDVARNDL